MSYCTFLIDQFTSRLVSVVIVLPLSLPLVVIILPLSLAPVIIAYPLKLLIYLVTKKYYVYIHLFWNIFWNNLVAIH